MYRCSEKEKINSSILVTINICIILNLILIGIWANDFRKLDQQLKYIHSLEIFRMACADVCPSDYHISCFRNDLPACATTQYKQRILKTVCISNLEFNRQGYLQLIIGFVAWTAFLIGAEICFICYQFCRSFQDLCDNFYGCCKKISDYLSRCCQDLSNYCFCRCCQNLCNNCRDSSNNFDHWCRDSCKKFYDCFCCCTCTCICLCFGDRQKIMTQLAQNNEISQLQIVQSQQRILDDNCSICLQPLVKWASLIKLKCGHIYHTSCLTEWYRRNQTCPYCRRKFKLKVIQA